jgi:hypothetical protein
MDTKHHVINVQSETNRNVVGPVPRDLLRKGGMIKNRERKKYIKTNLNDSLA